MRRAPLIVVLLFCAGCEGAEPAYYSAPAPTQPPARQASDAATVIARATDDAAATAAAKAEIRFAGDRTSTAVSNAATALALTPTAAALALRMQQDADRATATRQAQTTGDALSIQMTRISLSGTQEAQSIAATKAALDLAARAQATGDAQTRLATQGAMDILHAAATRAEQERQERQSAEWWATVRDAIKWFLIVLGVIILFTVAVWAWTWVDLRKEQLRAQIVAEHLLPAAGNDDWLTQWTGTEFKLLQIPALHGEVVVEGGWQTADESKQMRWRQTLRLFCSWGDRIGFGLRDMVAVKVVSDPDWRLLTKALKSAGVLADVTLYTNGKAHPGTGWADGMDYARFMRKLAAHEIVIPLPEELPVVRETVPT